MAKKAIVFLRVSSNKQTLEQQQTAMMEVALNDYKENEIIIVEGKESASKLDREQRKTLKSLYDAIDENPSIERIYFYAVDRLSRKAAMVSVIADEMSDKGIDCYFHHPYNLHTLTMDKKKNPIAEMMLFFLGKGAEMEGQMRNQRCEDKRKDMKANGQVYNGSILFGYRKNPVTKMIEINEEEAKWVHYIFNEYAEGNKSFQKLGNELIEKGVWKHKSISTDMSRVRTIVNNPAYSGRTPLHGEYKYPQIVSVELQEKCMQIKEKANKRKTVHKHVYFSKGLIKSGYSNRVMMASFAKMTYTTNREDEIKMHININALDSIVWYEGMMYTSLMLSMDDTTVKEGYKKTVQDLEQKKVVLKEQIDDLDAQEERAYKGYIKGKVSEKIYESSISELKKEQDRLQKELSNCTSEIARLSELLARTDVGTSFDDYLPNLNEATDEAKKEYIDKVFDSIFMTKMENGHYKIEIIPNPQIFNGIVQLRPVYEYYTYGNGNKMILKHNENGETVDVSNIFNRRITRDK